MNGTHYFSPKSRQDPINGDFSRLDLFENLDVILIGKSGTPADTERLQKELPLKKIGIYYMCPFEIDDTEAQTYPGTLGTYRTGVGYVVKEMNQATVEWHAKRAADKIGTAAFMLCDNSDPKQPIGPVGSYTTSDLANWREWVPKTMAAIGGAIGEAQLVANVGHTCNPMSTGNLPLRACYQQMCASVNGIGVEKKTGSTVATYSPATFQGPYLEPRMSLAFAQDAEAWAVTDAMALPSYVVKSVVKWVLVEEARA